MTINDPLLTIATDQLDYAPASTAVITASSVSEGGTVTFTVTHLEDPKLQIGLGAWSVTDGSADDTDGAVNGAIGTSWYVDPAAAGQSFALTATDAVTGAVATTTFTDSPTDTPIPAIPTIQNQTLFRTGDSDISTGTGVFSTFLQIQKTGFEEGFNTDAGKVLDSGSSPNFNHSILLGAIPTVTIDGIVYREFRLDLNEPNGPGASTVNLESLQIYKANVGNLTTLTGATQLYDMDGGANGKTGGGDDANVSVQLTAWDSGSGRGDYIVYIPNSFFAGSQASDYIYLYSSLSDADGGFEEWSVRTADAPPAPTAVLTIDKVTVDGGAVGDGLTVLAGDTISWQYVVRNTGTGSVSNVSVTDNQGVTPTYTGGDANNNNALDVGESWTFTASGIAVVGPYSNIGTAHGTGPVNGASTALTATNASSYFGAAPALTIVKETVDGTAHGDGLQILSGETISWAYHVVNSGNVALTNVRVMDDNGTPLNATDDVLVGTVASLAAGATFDLSYAGTAAIGAYRNNAIVTSNDFVDDAGHHAVVSDDDASNYFGLNPHLALDKKTNGVDHGLNVFAGTAVNWTYDVLNDGNVGLTHIVVRDNNGTPGIASDDFNAAPLLSGAFNSGDVNTNNVLDVGETWHFRTSGVALLGNYTNIATVTSDPVTDTAGHSRTPIASDSSDYEGYSNRALTQGFWGSRPDAWDGVNGSIGNPTRAAVNSGVLSAAEINPTTRPGYLLLGDSDHNGIANDAHNLWISIPLAQAIESAATTGDARLIMLQQTIATQLNINNGVAQPANLIDEAVMWLTGQGSWSGLGVNVDSNSDGVVDQGGTASKPTLGGASVATSGPAWKLYVDVVDNSTLIPEWDVSPAAGNQEVNGEGLKNALMWFNQDQLVTSGSGAGAHVAWFNGTSIVNENPNTLDQFWLTLHQQANLTGIG